MAETEEDPADRRRRQLIAFMRERKLTPRSWAEKAGLGDGTVRNFLSGKTTSMTQNTVDALVNALSGVKESDIFPEEMATPPQSVELHDSQFAQNHVASRKESHVTLVPRENPPETKDLPIRGHVKAGKTGFYIDQGALWGYAMRHESQIGIEEAYAVQVDDESMSPRFDPGDILQVHPFRWAPPGKDVVIQLNDGQSFIKRLVRRTDDVVAVKQFNPPETIEYKRGDVMSIHLVVGTDLSK